MNVVTHRSVGSQPVSLERITKRFGGLIAVVFLKEPLTRVRAASGALILGGLFCLRIF